MRVNMDSSIASDPRFKLVAADLGVSWREVVGSAFLVWLACYERRSERLSEPEVDIAAEVPGFASALAKHGLATRGARGKFKIHGVKDRIDFLLRQKEKGSSGGKKSGESRRSREAYASHDAEADASRSAQAYTPALDLDLDLDLAPAPDLAPDQNKQQHHVPQAALAGAVSADDGSKAEQRADEVRAVFEHYRRYHPRSHPEPSSKSVEWRKIKARLSEGYTVADLCTAIDGCHRSPWHQGENERAKRYDSLELIVRDGSKVQQFLEHATRPKPNGDEPGWLKGTRQMLAEIESREREQQPALVGKGGT